MTCEAAPRATPRRFRLGALLTAVLCAAPVPGDIGACGQPVQQLDAPRFFGAKKVVDCRKCRECGFAELACDTACDPSVVPDQEFPDGCEPLVHDGEVCLRVLLYASCEAYAPYISDDSPSVPTECDFCPRGER